MKEQKSKAHITEMRKVYWFEKFVWFITSEGYLVLCGRDAQQNDLLVKRHMDKHDAYGVWLPQTPPPPKRAPMCLPASHPRCI